MLVMGILVSNECENTEIEILSMEFYGEDAIEVYGGMESGLITNVSNPSHERFVLAILFARFKILEKFGSLCDGEKLLDNCDS
ncbi:hypothetical protein SLA2020_026000 [Shorea laevis]